jgi:hypothetical protein|tara:strand:- start:805 stop:939 length:135 start_codon:yes stop_codon:yes gene_type:complete
MFPAVPIHPVNGAPGKEAMFVELASVLHPKGFSTRQRSNANKVP